MDNKAIEAGYRQIVDGRRAEKGLHPVSDEFFAGLLASNGQDFRDHKAAITAYEAAKGDGWQPIDGALKDGTEYIVGYDFASIWIVHKAWWSTGTVQADDGSVVLLWEDQGFDSQEDAAGWWSYTNNSFSQSKLEGTSTPTHFLSCDTQPQGE